MLTSLLMSLPTLAEGSNPLTHVVDHPILYSRDGWWFLTNHMIMIFIAAGLMLAIFLPITRRYQSGEHIPTGTRNFFEALIVFIRDDVAKPVLGNHANAFMPYLWTLFFFILFINLLGLLPLEPITGYTFSWLGLDLHPIYGTATANIYVTGVLALLSFIMIQVSGIRENGLKNYLKHFMAGAPWYVAPILVPVELLGMFIKPFALFIRLVANMTAGHVLLAVLISFPVMAYGGLGRWGAVGIGIPVVLAGVAIMCLEVFVAFLQAYIFTMLTSLFIGQLILHEGEDHTGGEHDEAHEIIGSGDLTDYAKIPQPIRAAGSHMAG